MARIVHYVKITSPSQHLNVDLFTSLRFDSVVGVLVHNERTNASHKAEARSRDRCTVFAG